MPTPNIQAQSSTFGLYFILSRVFPGLSLLTFFLIFLPSATAFDSKILALILVLSFPFGQFVYSFAALVEKQKRGKEYHREQFEHEFNRKEKSSLTDEQIEVFNEEFQNIYGVKAVDLSTTEVYRLTRSAIELDGRARSIQWDALQSFSRSMKYTFALGVLVVGSLPISVNLISRMYIPLASSISSDHIIIVSIIFLFTSYTFHRAEHFYKKGYINYLLVDFCNINNI